MIEVSLWQAACLFGLIVACFLLVYIFTLVVAWNVERVEEKIRVLEEQGRRDRRVIDLLSKHVHQHREKEVPTVRGGRRAFTTFHEVVTLPHPVADRSTIKVNRPRLTLADFKHDGRVLRDIYPSLDTASVPASVPAVELQVTAPLAVLEE